MNKKVIIVICTVLILIVIVAASFYFKIELGYFVTLPVLLIAVYLDKKDGNGIDDDEFSPLSRFDTEIDTKIELDPAFYEAAAYKKKQEETKKALFEMPEIAASMKMKNYDPTFNCKDFYGFAQRVFKEFCKAWCDKNLKLIFHITKPEYYSFLSEELRKKIAVDKAEMSNFLINGNIITISVRLKCRIETYHKDANTGEIVKGHVGQRMNREYELTFKWEANENSISDKSLTNNCPNCGAVIPAEARNICQFCGTAIIDNDNKWLLSNVRQIRKI